MRADTEFDLIVYGATGYTGQLVAEYLGQAYAAGQSPRWAMAGRSAAKLDAVRQQLGLPASIALIEADAGRPESLAAMAARTRAVITTVGPYQLYGAPLVAACAAAGTDYLDLCGEPLWMRDMIAAHDAAARTSGARILFSCGFNSIPFEAGVFFLQAEARRRLGAPVPRVKGRVRKMKGTFSGGTAASLKATMAAVAADPSKLEALRNPFSLTPGFTGPKQPHGMAPQLDEELGQWAAPFVMAAINTRNVHRSNFLQGHAYGADFVYDEMMLTGAGERGEATAKAVAAAGSGLEREDGPKPGEGPSREERESGHYDILFLGIAADGRQVSVSVTGDRDPGYGSTSKMISECALALLLDAPDVAGGIWTPAAALGDRLIARLQARAGLRFSVE